MTRVQHGPRIPTTRELWLAVVVVFLTIWWAVWSVPLAHNLAGGTQPHRDITTQTCPGCEAVPYQEEAP